MSSQMLTQDTSNKAEGANGGTASLNGTNTKESTNPLPRKHGATPSPDDVSSKSITVKSQTDGDSAPKTRDRSDDVETAPTIPKTKPSVLDRLKRLGGIKLSKAKDRGTEVEFPPEEWGFDGRSEDVKAASELAIEPVVSPSSDSVQIKVEEDTVTNGMNTIGRDTPTEPPARAHTPDEAERPEPVTLAQRIQSLLSSTPRLSFSAPSPSSSGSSSVPPPLSSQSNPPSTDSDRKPDPPSDEFPKPNPTSAALITDSRLISLLSSASVMNGSISKGRESVWAILDRLGLSRANSTATNGMADNRKESKSLDVKGKDEAWRAVAKGDAEVPGSEDVMLYAPLVPDDASEVEVAQSEVVEVKDDDELTAESAGVDQRLSSPETEKSQDKEKEKSEKEKKAKEVKKVKAVKEKVIWVPSVTKISVQATWWGYRIFLPPPVLVVLNSKSMEAAKRATLITTALKWLLDHIPTKLLPPQLRPAAVLLKRLVPLLGYIGAFIAWSWGAIRTFDRGSGVVLSATWLLPVAIIPGTWDLNEFPTHAPPVGFSQGAAK